VVGTVVISPTRAADGQNVVVADGNGDGAGVTAAAVAGFAESMVFWGVAPGDTGTVHPAARIIPDNKTSRKMVLLFISTGYSSGAQILSGRAPQEGAGWSGEKRQNCG